MVGSFGFYLITIAEKGKEINEFLDDSVPSGDDKTFIIFMMIAFANSSAAYSMGSTYKIITS